ncbi:hypothetical protein [Legionella sp. WA2022007384]
MKIKLRIDSDSARRRSKLEPPYDAGDCGYYALCVGLLHLGMQAKTNIELAALINQSAVLKTIFTNMPQVNKVMGSDNVSTLENVLEKLGEPGWDSLTLKEVLTEFSNGVRRALVESDWGTEYFKTMLKEGAWVIDNQKWMDLPPFRRLNVKILDRMAELANGKNVSPEQAGELRFQATLEIFKGLSDSVLEDMAKAVVQKYYGPGSEKAWLDAEFLKYFSEQMFPMAENLFFDPSKIEITSTGPSSTHWYIDVPKDTTTDSLLKLVNSGSSKYLIELEVYRVKEKGLNDLSALKHEHYDLLKVQKKLIAKFKETASGLYAKHLDSSFSEDVLFGLSALSLFDKEPPSQETIDEVLMPIISIDDKSFPEFTELSMTRKSIVDINEKINKVEKELELKKQKASVSSLIHSDLSFKGAKKSTVGGKMEKIEEHGTSIKSDKGFPT